MEKNLSEFHRDCKSPDGYRGTCKICHRAVIKEWKKNNREKVRGYDKKHKELHKEEALKYSKKWKSRNPGKQTKYAKTYINKYPEKYKAHQAVRDAVREGRLIKKPCKCGCIKVQGHHEDYSKLLEVEWMCQPCHKEYHRRK